MRARAYPEGDLANKLEMWCNTRRLLYVKSDGRQKAQCAYVNTSD